LRPVHSGRATKQCGPAHQEVWEKKSEQKEMEMVLRSCSPSSWSAAGAAVAARASANPPPPRPSSPPSRPSRRVMDAAAGVGRHRVRIAVVGDVVPFISLDNHALSSLGGRGRQTYGFGTVIALCYPMLGSRFKGLEARRRDTREDLRTGVLHIDLIVAVLGSLDDASLSRVRGWARDSDGS
jgi:hypothetical protein